MYKRYANPIELLSTYDIGDLMGFFVYLFEVENEEKLWQIWINKDVSMSFDDFKESSLKKTKKMRLSKKSEAAAIAKAEQILQIKEYREVGEI